MFYILFWNIFHTYNHTLQKSGLKCEKLWFLCDSHLESHMWSHIFHTSFKHFFTLYITYCRSVIWSVILVWFLCEFCVIHTSYKKSHVWSHLKSHLWSHMWSHIYFCMGRLSSFLFHFESVLQILVGSVATILSLNATHLPTLVICLLNSCNKGVREVYRDTFIIICCLHLIVHILTCYYLHPVPKTKLCVVFIGFLVWWVILIYSIIHTSLWASSACSILNSCQLIIVVSIYHKFLAPA